MDRKFLDVLCISEAANELSEVQNKRKYWVHPVNLYHSNEHFDKVYLKRREHPNRFFTYYRMSIQLFDELMEKIRSRITK